MRENCSKPCHSEYHLQSGAWAHLGVCEKCRLSDPTLPCSISICTIIRSPKRVPKEGKLKKHYSKPPAFHRWTQPFVSHFLKL
jgi:hypothetical protein